MNAKNSDLSKILEAREQEKAIVSSFLSRELRLQGNFPVTIAEMGKTPTYCTSILLETFAASVRYAGQLPTLKGSVSEVGYQIEKFDSETVDLLMQRPPDWSRQVSLALYLIIQQFHFFPSILVVVMQDWAFDDSNDSYWDEGEDGIRRAKQSTIALNPLDEDGKIGFVKLESEHFIYTLDGQHRQMGIVGALDLIKRGSLPILKKDGKPTNGILTLDEIVGTYDVDEFKVQGLGGESIGLQLIPGVQEGESLDEARRRIRSTFVHVNEYANRLTKGESNQIDEDNGFKIIARQIALNHPLFKDKDDNDNPLINMSSTTVAERSKIITTLTTLGEMAKSYLGPLNISEKPRRTFRSKWEPEHKGLIPLRPADEELTKGMQLFSSYIDRLSQIPSFEEIQQGKSIVDVRNFPEEKYPDRKGHMLLRPVGQQALTQAVALLISQNEFSLESVFQKIKTYDERGGFSLHIPQNPWYRVLYDPDRKTIINKGQDLAAKLLRHILGGGTPNDLERKALLASFAQARTVEDKALDLEGNQVSEDKVKLPLPIQ